MITLPADLCDPLFDDKFKRGCVIRTDLECHDGRQRPHYFIVLTNFTDLPTQALLVATSQTNFYDKYPYFNSDILRIPAKQLSFFPSDTVIDCRKIHEFNRDVLKQRFRDNILQFAGILPEQLCAKLTEIIKQSRHLSIRDRELILGGNFLDTQ